MKKNEEIRLPVIKSTLQRPESVEPRPFAKRPLPVAIMSLQAKGRPLSLQQAQLKCIAKTHQKNKSYPNRIFIEQNEDAY
jgi:hypothetical protein